MDWVTYLSPSGGGTRVGVVEDGDVLGCPVADDLAALLEAGQAAMAHARERAVEAPVEIIFEPEARKCAPVVPEEPVMVRFGDGEVDVSPDLVLGVDDGVVPRARGAHVGLAAIAGGEGPASAFTTACLWLDEDARPVQLTLGPDLVTADEVVETVQEFTAMLEDRVVGHAVISPDDAWLRSGPGRVRALLRLATPLLEIDDELAIDAGALGGFEVRVGSEV